MGKNKNSKAALFTLTLLETCVKNCRREFRVLVCGREWAEEMHQASLESPGAVRDQVLGLLQSWAAAFSSDPAMAGVGELVAGLRARGVEFPEPSTQDIILTSSQVGGVLCVLGVQLLLTWFVSSRVQVTILTTTPVLSPVTAPSPM